MIRIVGDNIADADELRVETRGLYSLLRSERDE